MLDDIVHVHGANKYFNNNYICYKGTGLVLVMGETKPGTSIVSELQRLWLRYFLIISLKNNVQRLLLHQACLDIILMIIGRHD